MLEGAPMKVWPFCVIRILGGGVGELEVAAQSSWYVITCVVSEFTCARMAGQFWWVA